MPIGEVWYETMWRRTRTGPRWTHAPHTATCGVCGERTQVWWWMGYRYCKAHLPELAQALMQAPERYTPERETAAD